MRGELNPLEIVLDGGKCKYCLGADITEGQWEVDPETKEVFHVKCKEIAQTYYDAGNLEQEDSLVVSDQTLRSFAKMHTGEVRIDEDVLAMERKVSGEVVGGLKNEATGRIRNVPVSILNGKQKKSEYTSLDPIIKVGNIPEYRPEPREPRELGYAHVEINPSGVISKIGLIGDIQQAKATAKLLESAAQEVAKDRNIEERNTRSIRTQLSEHNSSRKVIKRDVNDMIHDMSGHKLSDIYKDEK